MFVLIAAAFAPLPAAASAPPTGIPYPPVTTARPESRPPQLVTFAPGPVQCGGTVPTPAFAPQPLPIIASGYQLSQIAALQRPVQLRFSIGSDGKPFGIRFAPTDEREADARQNILLADIQPTLAASTFAAGMPHSDCRIAFAINASDIATARKPDLARAYALRIARGTYAQQIFKALLPAGATCYESGELGLLERHMPDFAAIPSRPGALDYTVLTYDIAGNGKVESVRTIASSGNSALDKASESAVTQDRYATTNDPARTGCLRYFWRNGPDVVAAPPRRAAMDDVTGCAASDDEWINLGTLRYPPAFQRRRIEGWVRLRYDVAPWGEIGNVAVVAAEPASDFADPAMQIMRNATKPKSIRGYSGCERTVLFSMAKDGLRGSDESEVGTEE